MADTITQAVGAKGVNDKQDVSTVTDLLNGVSLLWGGPLQPLSSPPTKDDLADAIRYFTTFQLGQESDTLTPSSDGMARLREIAKTSERPGQSATQLNYLVPRGDLISGMQKQPAASAKQPPLTCWATVATILCGWKDQKCLLETAVMQRTGDSHYLDLYNNNQVLPFQESNAFASKLGFARSRILANDNNVSYWKQRLETVGPMDVTINLSAATWHFIVLKRIVGDGTSYGTKFGFHDPAVGKERTILFRTFRDIYTSSSPDPNALTMWHW